ARQQTVVGEDVCSSARRRVGVGYGFGQFFFFQAEDGIRDGHVTGVQTCALPIFGSRWRDIRRPRSRLERKDRVGGHAEPDGGRRSEERRVGKEWRSRWWAYH